MRFFQCAVAALTAATLFGFTTGDARAAIASFSFDIRFDGDNCFGDGQDCAEIDHYADLSVGDVSEGFVQVSYNDAAPYEMSPTRTVYDIDDESLICQVFGRDCPLTILSPTASMRPESVTLDLGVDPHWTFLFEGAGGFASMNDFDGEGIYEANFSLANVRTGGQPTIDLPPNIVAVIPLPAAFPMLLGALAIFGAGVYRRRRR